MSGKRRTIYASDPDYLWAVFRDLALEETMLYKKMRDATSEEEKERARVKMMMFHERLEKAREEAEKASKVQERSQKRKMAQLQTELKRRPALPSLRYPTRPGPRIAPTPRPVQPPVEEPVRKTTPPETPTQDRVSTPSAPAQEKTPTVKVKVKPGKRTLRSQLLEHGNPTRVWKMCYEGRVSRSTIYSWVDEYGLKWNELREAMKDIRHTKL